MFRQFSCSVLLSFFVLVVATAIPAGAFFKPVKSGAPMGVAHLCNHLVIAYARNPSIAGDLIAAATPYFERALKTRGYRPAKRGEFRTAAGLIGGGLVLARARNPTLADKLVIIAETCLETLETGEVPVFDLEDEGQ